MAGNLEELDQGEIVITLIGTIGQMDRPEGEHYVRTLEDSLLHATEIVKKLEPKYCSMGWTCLVAHKKTSTGENLISKEYNL